MMWPFKKKVEKVECYSSPMRIIPEGWHRAEGGGITGSFDIKIELPEKYKEEIRVEKKLDKMRHFGMLMQAKRKEEV